VNESADATQAKAKTKAATATAVQPVPSEAAIANKVKQLGGNVTFDPQGYVAAIIFTTGQLKDQDVASFVGLQKINRIRLYGPGITDGVLNHLTKMPTLVDIETENTSLTNQSLPRFKEFPGLVALGLRRSNIRDDGLVHLKDLGKLQRLSLLYTSVSDEGLKHFRDMRNLRLLDVRACLQITNDGLAHLS
jgi:hypothetical protein